MLNEDEPIAPEWPCETVQPPRWNRHERPEGLLDLRQRAADRDAVDRVVVDVRGGVADGDADEVGLDRVVLIVEHDRERERVVVVLGDLAADPDGVRGLAELLDAPAGGCLLERDPGDGLERNDGGGAAQRSGGNGQRDRQRRRPRLSGRRRERIGMSGVIPPGSVGARCEWTGFRYAAGLT